MDSLNVITADVELDGRYVFKRKVTLVDVFTCISYLIFFAFLSYRFDLDNVESFNLVCLFIISLSIVHDAIKFIITWACTSILIDRNGVSYQCDIKRYSWNRHWTDLQEVYFDERRFSVMIVFVPLVRLKQLNKSIADSEWYLVNSDVDKKIMIGEAVERFVSIDSSGDLPEVDGKIKFQEPQMIGLKDEVPAKIIVLSLGVIFIVLIGPYLLSLITLKSVLNLLPLAVFGLIGGMLGAAYVYKKKWSAFRMISLGILAAATSIIFLVYVIKVLAITFG